MKKTLALILTLAMVLALCACGGSKAPAAEAPAAEAPAAEAPAEAEKDYSGYTIRIYSNSNST